MALLQAVSNRKNRLLAALPPADLERYFSGLGMVDLRQKQVLIEQGAPITDLYFLEEGIASLLTTMTDGSTIEFSMIGMEGIVGVSACSAAGFRLTKRWFRFQATRCG